MISKFIIVLVALVHLYILWFEMFAWETKGPKVFRHFSKDLFKPTRAMAGNQGLYNGFLAAGLIWSLLISDEVWSQNVALFFLGCVMVAGFYGALTADKKILFVQSVPAAAGIVSIFFQL